MPRHVFLAVLCAVFCTSGLVRAQDEPLRVSPIPAPDPNDIQNQNPNDIQAKIQFVGHVTWPLSVPRVIEAENFQCMWRESRPVELNVDITRWVGPVDGDGRLIDPEALINAGVISATAKLEMPAYDVDVNGGYPGDGTFPDELPEIDRVSVNDTVVGTLTGEDEIWKLNTFEVPIASLRFPQRGALGSAPAPAHNTIKIEIDTGNPDSNFDWCTSVDWAALSFKALSPVVLVHGNGSDAAFWDRHGFSGELSRNHIPFDGCAAAPCENRIDLPKSTIEANGDTLAGVIPDIVKSFGAHSYHIVAHSKGGLDARAFLVAHQPPHLKLLSLTTLSTPHDGSLLADLLVLKDTYSEAVLRGIPSLSALLAAIFPVDDAKRSLTTTAVAGFNALNLQRLPSAVDYNQVGADADRNGSGELEQSEIDAMLLDKWFTRIPRLGLEGINENYKILRDTARLELKILRSPPEPPNDPSSPDFIAVEAIPSPGPTGNDSLVTIPSALGTASIQSRSTHASVFVGTDGRNHSDVADSEVAQAVLPWLFDADRSKGGLQP